MSARPRLAVAFAFALLCVALLSVSLIGVDLRPGAAGPMRVDAPAPAGAAAQDGPGILLLVLRIALIVLVAFAAVYIVVSLFSARGRKRLLGMAIVLVVVLLALTLLSRVHPQQGDRAIQQDTVMGRQPAESGASAAASVPFEPRPPRWLLWAAVATIGVLAVGGAAGLALVLSRRRRPSIREKLADETEAAMEALKAGADLKDVVIRCYHQMTLIAQEEMGIHRQITVTAREFQVILETSGLPAEPVRDLTRAFEQIRYGHAAPSTGTEQLAISSLERISQYCRGSR